MPYKLLDKFEGLFRGAKYRHRNSTQGDLVAGYLYEDLYDLGKSSKLIDGINTHRLVLNKKNRATGLRARRGDGSFGERVPSVPAIVHAGHAVAIGDVATVEIGVEVKILAKAMIKQIDRVSNDMRNQADEFRRHHRNAVCVGIAGINQAPQYTSYEGARAYPTDGRKYVHPIQEAAAAEAYIREHVARHYDELLVLRFSADNSDTLEFRWLNPTTTAAEYSAGLVRIAREYDQRF